jgi:hypothetical protein
MIHKVQNRKKKARNKEAFSAQGMTAALKK